MQRSLFLCPAVERVMMPARVPRPWSGRQSPNSYINSNPPVTDSSFTMLPNNPPPSADLAALKKEELRLRHEVQRQTAIVVAMVSDKMLFPR